MEPLSRRLARRLVTVPVVVLAGLLTVALIPLWLPIALIVDVIRPGPPVTARLGLCLLVYFWMTFGGMLGCLKLSILRLLRIIPDHDRYLEAHYALQYWWGNGLLRGTFSLMKLKLSVEGSEHLDQGPVLIFMRHVTLLDTLLPAACFGQPRTLRPRYLLKKELLSEPSLDICGNRIPNVFVDRSGKHRETMLAEVETLASGIGARDSVVLYPEGTRFTLAKQKRLREKLAASGQEEHLLQAKRLQNLLPVRVGGPAACFKAAPQADVIIVGHVGLEGAANFSDFLNGRVYNQTVHVRIWRTPQSELPEGVDARSAWLNERWEELDAWIQGISSSETKSEESAVSGSNQSA